jgi:hypothetical protein
MGWTSSWTVHEQNLNKLNLNKFMNRTWTSWIMACFSFGTISRRGLTGASACYDMLYALFQKSMAFTWHGSTYKTTWIQTHTCTHTPQRKFIHETSVVDKFASHTQAQTKSHKTCITCRQSFTSTITLAIQSLLLCRTPCVHGEILQRRKPRVKNVTLKLWSVKEKLVKL